MKPNVADINSLRPKPPIPTDKWREASQQLSISFCQSTAKGFHHVMHQAILMVPEISRNAESFGQIADYMLDGFVASLVSTATQLNPDETKTMEESIVAQIRVKFEETRKELLRQKLLTK